jgi:CheY-like chemotaxis protein
MIEYSAESSVEVVVDLDEKKSIWILHVDDKPGLLRIAKQCLEMQGSFQVDTESSIEEAIGKMEKEDYDAIVSDYRMPGKDGLEFLRELRQSGNNVPFRDIHLERQRRSRHQGVELRRRPIPEQNRRSRNSIRGACPCRTTSGGKENHNEGN